MSDPRTARAQIKKFAAVSKNKPSFYYVHGYFVALAINPQMIPPSNWLTKVFVGLEIQDEVQFDDMAGLMWQFNDVMQHAMSDSIKLPAQCKLSPTDFEGSLKKDAPLPQWCTGLLAGLKLIDKRALTKGQKAILKEGESIFSAFLSYDTLKDRFSDFADQWQETALGLRRTLAYQISDLLFTLRFANEVEDFLGVDDDFLADDLDDENDEYQELVNFALYNDSIEAHTMLETLILAFEKSNEKGYFKENIGHFWLIHETRPYMQLRARRAGIKYSQGQVKDACTELQELIELNPFDNLGLRFPLSNWLAMQANWADLAQLLALFPDDQSLPLLGANALMLFANEGDSAAARRAKKAMHQANKHVIKYLTGQKQAKKELAEYYQPGQTSEAEMYVQEYAKEAWRSVPGSLFWLRRS
jgi:yecA family protein